MVNIAAIEQKLRRRLSAQGYGLRKSRKQTSTMNDMGYMIYDRSTNFIQAGERYDLSLEDVQKWAYNES